MFISTIENICEFKDKLCSRIVFCFQLVEELFFNITINGSSSHSGLPHLSNNALACEIKIAELIEEIPSRYFSFTDGITLSEDFAKFSRCVPSLMTFVSAGS